MPGAGIPEFMGGQPASGHSVPTTVVAPAQATWVDDIANALDSYFKAHYPTTGFTSALKTLTLVRNAECCAPLKLWTGHLVSWMPETH